MSLVETSVCLALTGTETGQRDNPVILRQSKLILIDTEVQQRIWNETYMWSDNVYMSEA